MQFLRFPGVKQKTEKTKRTAFCGAHTKENRTHALLHQMHHAGHPPRYHL